MKMKSRVPIASLRSPVLLIRTASPRFNRPPIPRSPVPPPFRTPFPTRKNVRRLFAEEERPWSAGSRAGYTRRVRSAMRLDTSSHSPLSRSPAFPYPVPYPQKRPQTFCGGGAAMERRPPAGIIRRERSAMRRDDLTALSLPARKLLYWDDKTRGGTVMEAYPFSWARRTGAECWTGNCGIIFCGNTAACWWTAWRG